MNWNKKVVLILLGLWLVAMVVTTLMITLIVDANAHDAVPTAAQPQGWVYPYSCCSGVDCRAVDHHAVKEDQQGFIVPSGEIIPMLDSRVRESPDGEYHWCTYSGTDEGKTICLFVPPRGY